MKRQQRLLLILAFGVFSILNTEMGIIGILPMAAEMYQVDIVQAGMLVSLFALGVAIAGPTMPLLFSRFNRKHVMLLVLGVFNGSARDVFGKAVKICTECVGLG